MNNIAPQSPVMRRLTLQDNPAIARVIRQVSAEYGLTADKGYTVLMNPLMIFIKIIKLR